MNKCRICGERYIESADARWCEGTHGDITMQEWGREYGDKANDPHNESLMEPINQNTCEGVK